MSKASDVHYHYGFDDRFVSLYRETYWKFDFLAPLAFFGVGEVTSLMDCPAMEAILRGRFKTEWADPQGWIDAANVVLVKSVVQCAIMAVVRSKADGMADDKMHWRMRLVFPHVRRAVLIGNVIERKTAEAASLADTLDGISAGMFLVDAAGRIMHANVAGHLLLAAGGLLRTSAGGRLVADDPQVDRVLHDVFVAAASGDEALGAKGIAVPHTARDGERHVIHVLPLTSGARRRAGANYAAAAALFIHKAALTTSSPPVAIAQTYALTPTELRVLLAVVEIGGVPEVAEALGVGETTVRFHLRQLFDKTGTHRQAELVKLVAGYVNPLVK
ncbi:MAG TPA: helix-turn-helix transcriptional regulator [Vineibacter sp.]|nr:helix-turn-helix transcriptional regulator [Vineibacter sp.]